MSNPINDAPANSIVAALLAESNARATNAPGNATDIAALRTTINAIITAAGTSLAAVAAVTPAPAGTATVVANVITPRT